MSRTDDVASEARRLATYLERYGHIAKAWLTNFCTEDHWSNFFSADTRQVLLSLSDSDMQRLPVDLPIEDHWPEELRELLEVARFVAPPERALSAAAEGHGGASEFLFKGVPHARNMSPKKQHEVLRLAPLVADTALKCGARTIVDLGSGHGYLSHVLSFHHGLHVVGLEALADNVAAAHHRAWMVREKLLNPRFRVGDGKGGSGVSSGKKKKAASGAALHALNASAGGGEVSAAAAAVAAATEAALAKSTADAADAAARGAPSPLITHNGGSFCNVTVTLPTDATRDWLEETLQPAVAQIEAYVAAGAEKDEAAVAAAGAHERGGSVRRFLLVGLHACGDLTPTLLRLAATASTVEGEDYGGEARPRCVGIVSVGCCYHRVTESLPEGTRPDLSIASRGAPASAAASPTDVKAEPTATLALRDLAPSVTGVEVTNFPMSRVCRDLGCSLGEIARHLSLQAVWRWPAPMTPIDETSSRCRQFLFRCVLEVRLQQLRQPGAKADGMRLPRDGNVGAMLPCATFEEYARKACGRLGIEYDDAEAATLAELWEAHAHMERPMRCFVMIRGVLSRPIERLLTLDRLLFMREAGLHEAAADEIFDPRISPRSNAIVATWAGQQEKSAPSAAAPHSINVGGETCAPCEPEPHALIDE